LISKPCQTDFRLDGKVAVVTGGASGIGLATAELFSQKGAAVCVCDIRGQESQEVAQRLQNARGYQVDISQPDSVDRTAREILGDWGKVDVLVNSAGVGDIEWAEDMSPKMWQRVIDINLTGTFLMTSRFGKIMIDRGEGGKIISLASQAGIVAIDKHIAYSASKAGIISMMKSLALEWGKYGIQANAISPTATETPIIVGYWDVGERHRKAIEDTPCGRFCKPIEIACAALFLASEASNMVNGENLVVDGGYTIH
jgi:NAD(P)-dependent dehydrogenase (short-subunit alcohol dehydrogenase family)